MLVFINVSLTNISDEIILVYGYQTMRDQYFREIIKGCWDNKHVKTVLEWVGTFLRTHTYHVTIIQTPVPLYGSEL